MPQYPQSFITAKLRGNRGLNQRKDLVMTASLLCGVLQPVPFTMVRIASDAWQVRCVFGDL